MPAKLYECISVVRRGQSGIYPFPGLFDLWRNKDSRFNQYERDATFLLRIILNSKTIEPQCELVPFSETVSAFFSFVDAYIADISARAADRYLQFHEKGDHEKARMKFAEHLQKGTKIGGEMDRCLRMAKNDYDLNRSPALALKREPSTMTGVGSVVKDPIRWNEQDHSESMRRQAKRSSRIK